MYKKFMPVVLSLFTLLLSANADSPSPFRVEPYLQNLSQNGVTIICHTETPAYGWIEYGETDELGVKKDSVIDGLRNANTTLHKIRLTGLEPGTTYYYRAGVKPILNFAAYKVEFAETQYSKTFSFKTPSADRSEISCVIFNDLHNNYPLFERLCGVLEGVDYQFSIFNGDCFSDPASEEDALTALEIYNKGISAHSRPPLYIRGNHEIRGAYARHLKKMFDFPEDEYFFAATAGPVRFIFLDCGEDKSDDHKEYSGLNDFSGYREKQKEWLKYEIESKEFRGAKYRILVHHIPLYNHNDRGVSKFSRALWAPAICDVPIDLAISGHVHVYNFVNPNEAGNNYPVLIGGGRKMEDGTVTVLSASDERLSVKVFNTDGEIIKDYKIKRN